MQKIMTMYITEKQTDLNFLKLEGNCRDLTLYFGGSRRFCPVKIFCNLFLFLITVVDQLINGPGYSRECCPAKMHCTSVFALRKWQIIKIGGGDSPLNHPLGFVPGDLSLFTLRLPPTSMTCIIP